MSWNYRVLHSRSGNDAHEDTYDIVEFYEGLSVGSYCASNIHSAASPEELRGMFIRALAQVQVAIDDPAQVLESMDFTGGGS